MASSDFRPTGSEGNTWHPEVGSAVIAPGWLGAAHVTAGSRLDDFLYAGQARPVQAAPEPANDAPATDASPLSAAHSCPHCAARLSAVELKMERCLACGNGLRVNSGSADGFSTDNPLTIGI